MRRHCPGHLKCRLPPTLALATPLFRRLRKSLLGGWDWFASSLACGRVVGPNFGSVRWAFCGVWAPCFSRAVRGRGTLHVFEKLRIYYLSVLLSKRRASEFGNWEQTRSDRITQDSDRGELKGLPKGFCRPGSRGSCLCSLPPSPPPAPWARSASTGLPRPAAALVPSPSGILRLYPGPSTV